MFKHGCRWFAVAVALASVLAAGAQTGSQTRRTVTEKIEWTWEVAADKPDPALPNVLLIGDSITRAYAPTVIAALLGKANVYFVATSASVGDFRLPHQIEEYFAMTRPISWAVVHFNNGMHGWGYTEDEYARYFPEMLNVIRDGAPAAKLIWSTTTPVRVAQASGASLPRIEARNQIAAKIMAKENIPTDDQYGLMLSHQDLHSDDVHFKDEGSAIQGKQVAATVLKALGK